MYIFPYETFEALLVQPENVVTQNTKIKSLHRYYLLAPTKKLRSIYS